MARASQKFGKRARNSRALRCAIEWLEARTLLTGTGNLVFDDEFNQTVGTQPNTSTWDAYLPDDPNNQNVIYTNTTSTLSVVADPQATDGRALAMTLTPISGGKFDSSEISTQIDPIGDSLEYGSVSARIKLPSATNAAGIWPAFWMLGNNLNTPEQPGNTVEWPLSGEIDIVENKGSTPGQAQGSLHAGGQVDNPDYNPTGVYNLPAGQVFSSSYHVFAISWTPTSISFSVDGAVYETQNISSSGVPSDDVGRFQHPFFVILDVNEGGSFAGGNNGTQYTATSPTTMYVDYVRVSGYQIASSPYTLPSSPVFSDADVGAVGLGGSGKFDGIAWIDTGSGTGVSSTADQFNFASQTVTGNVTIVAEVNTITNTANSAQAGIMIRDGTAANASDAFTFVTPNNSVAGEGANFTYRNGTGTTTQSDNVVSGITAPEWLMLVRSGNTFTAYYSIDGSTWTQNGTSQTIVMNATVNVGLAVSSATNSAVNTVNFEHVSMLQNGWTDTDVGSPNALGSASYNFSTATWTVGGGGADIFGTADQFNLASETLTGDGSIVAEVNSIANTNAWAKAGVMLRNNSSAGSDYVNVDVTDTNGITFQWRSAANGNVVSADTVTVAGLSAPYWVELTRAGNVFTAYYSPTGASWTQIGSPQTITMNSTVLAGLAVTSHDVATLNQTTFSNVVVTTNFAQQTGANLNVNFDVNADPITLGGGSGNVTVAEDGTTLAFSGVNTVTVNFASAATDVLNVNGSVPVSVQFNNEGTSDSVNVSSGTVTIAGVPVGASVQTITLGGLTIGSGAQVLLATPGTPPAGPLVTVNTLGDSGTLDVGGNQFNVHYGNAADPIANVNSLLSAGYNGGSWNGSGIISSTVAGLNVSQSNLIYGVGSSDGADGVVSGLSSGQIEILPTLAGDAKLAENVVFGDFQLLAANFGSSGGWDAGNFTYASSVTFGDFQLLAQNFGSTSAIVTGGEESGIAGFGAKAVAPVVAPSASLNTTNSAPDVDGTILTSAGDDPLYG